MTIWRHIIFTFLLSITAVSGLPPRTITNHLSLHNAVANSDWTTLQSLISQGENINTADNLGRTPLHIAAAQGDQEIVKFLLEQGADANTENEHGSTPIYIATVRRHINIVRLLLDYGANVDKANKNGDTPLYSAVEFGHLEMVQLLKNRGANLLVAGPTGRTALQLAIQKGKTRIAELLQMAQFHVPEGWSPVHYAAAKGHLDVLKILFQRGESLTATDHHGKTPMDYAYENVRIDVIDYLQDTMNSGLSGYIQSFSNWWGSIVGGMSSSADTLRDIVMHILDSKDQDKMERLLTHADRYHIVLNHDLNNEKNTLLMEFIIERNVNLVRQLLEIASKNHKIPLDANAHYIDPDDSFVRIHPLDYTMNHLKNPDLVSVLLVNTKYLPRCFDINSQDPSTGRTAPMNAITSSNLEMVQLFVETAISENLYFDASLQDSQGHDIFKLSDKSIYEYLKSRQKELQDLQSLNTFDCCVCWENKSRNDAFVLPCAHNRHICRDCEDGLYRNEHGMKTCPMCRLRYV